MATWFELFSGVVRGKGCSGSNLQQTLHPHVVVTLDEAFDLVDAGGERQLHPGRIAGLEEVRFCLEPVAGPVSAAVAFELDLEAVPHRPVVLDHEGHGAGSDRLGFRGNRPLAEADLEPSCTGVDPLIVGGGSGGLSLAPLSLRRAAASVLRGSLMGFWGRAGTCPQQQGNGARGGGVLQRCPLVRQLSRFNVRRSRTLRPSHALGTGLGIENLLLETLPRGPSCC